MSTPPQSLLPGTLEVLILKAVSLGSEHGYGLLLRLQVMSRDALVIEQGALYPALFRLEQQGMIEAEWGLSEKNRRAKFYVLTAAGRKRLASDLKGWRSLVATMDLVLGARSLGLSR
ncbi:MAG: PadR family transcriptional regulator [Acidobacteriota bacterium]